MKTDLLIIGGGPGGAAAGMFLIREGIKPIILEQEVFPRYHIGEAMTGEAGQVLRRLGLEDEMVKREHPVKHGVRVSERAASIAGTFQWHSGMPTGISRLRPRGRSVAASSIP